MKLGIKLKKSRLIKFSAILFLLMLIEFSFAATVNVSGVVSNQSPAISAVYIAKATDGACDSGDYPSSGTTVSGFTPGTDALCVEVIVSDPNGNDTISLTSTDTNILVWSDSNGATAAQAATAHGWDRHKIVAFEDCSTAASKTTMSASDTKFCGELPPDTDSTSDSGISVKDINGGGWDVNVFVQDTNRSSANAQYGLVNSVTVNTTIGISLSSSSCTITTTADTNFALNCGGTPQEKITVTHIGNIAEKVYAYMSTIFSSPSTIAGNSFYWKTSQISTPSTTDINANATSTTNNNCVSQPLNLWDRGTQSSSTTLTQPLFWYGAIPKISPGSYSGGKITLTTYAQATTCT